jgi:predicted DNA-binding transcriptional regulator YafY
MHGVYTPASRLLTLLDLLQSRPALGALELARALEVDPRSVRRYVTMLQDMGIPVEARRGRYGGYALRPGYKLPPLMLSDDEALAVTLGLLAARALPLAEVEPAAAGALAKLERVLPAPTRARAQALASTVRLDLDAHSGAARISKGYEEAEARSLSAEASVAIIATLSEAALAGRSIWMRYRSADGAPTERLLDPYGVAYLDGRWYVVGYCHLREGPRTFRLNRIQAIAPRDERFTRPERFDALEFAVQSFAAIPEQWLIEALLDTSLAAARRVTPPTFATLESTPEGILLRAYDGDLDHAARFLVSVGAPFRALGPPELREALARLAAEIASAAACPPERS